MCMLHVQHCLLHIVLFIRQYPSLANTCTPLVHSKQFSACDYRYKQLSGVHQRANICHSLRHSHMLCLKRLNKHADHDLLPLLDQTRGFFDAGGFSPADIDDAALLWHEG